MFNISSALLDLITTATTVLLVFPTGYGIMVNETPRDWWKRLTRTGWFIVIICFIQAGGAWLKYQAVATEKKQDSIQNAKDRKLDQASFVGKVEEALKKQGKQIIVDKVTNTLKVIDTIRDHSVDPVLAINFDSTKIVESYDKKIYLHASAVAINQEIAFHVIPHIYTFGVENNKLNFTTADKKVGNKDMRVFGRVTGDFSLELTVPKGATAMSDTTFVLIKVNYSNKETNGKQMPTVREIYFIEPGKIPDSPSSIKVRQLGDQKTYSRIVELLKKDKRW